MTDQYAAIVHTPSVLDAQERHGSRRSIARALTHRPAHDSLGDAEIAFIGAADSFYLATVSSTGWPYVQHRGGPPGFLQVLGPTTLAWADFRGNRQYVSTGNVADNPRVSLILVDHAEQRRLKILGTARTVDASDDPDLAVRLTDPGYRARVERSILIDVAAFDWNCPQHITPRYTPAQVEATLRPMQTEIDHLREISRRQESEHT